MMQVEDSAHTTHDALLPTLVSLRYLLLQTTFPADIWEAAGGLLKPEEAAAVQRWRTAVAADAPEAESWVTKDALNQAGLLNDAWHVEVCH